MLWTLCFRRFRWLIQELSLQFQKICWRSLCGSYITNLITFYKFFMQYKSDYVSIYCRTGISEIKGKFTKENKSFYSVRLLWMGICDAIVVLSRWQEKHQYSIKALRNWKSWPYSGQLITSKKGLCKLFKHVHWHVWLNLLEDIYLCYCVSWILSFCRKFVDND